MCKLPIRLDSEVLERKRVKYYIDVVILKVKNCYVLKGLYIEANTI